MLSLSCQRLIWFNGDYYVRVSVRRAGIYLTIILLLMCLSGCAVNSPIPGRPVTAAQQAWLLSGKPVLGEDATPLVMPDDAVMDLSPEMVAFVDRLVPARADDRTRLRALLTAIMHPGALGIEYEAGATYTAQEVFSRRRANCLAFTNFVVALMREVGLKVHYNEVEVPYVWDMSDNSTLILYKHINAIVRLRNLPDKVVDIAMEEYDTSYKQRKIPDTLALAQHYNNRAMEFLVQDNYPEAIRYMAAALDIEPDVSYFWSNLGAVYRRSGRLEAAELAYRLALQHDPSDLVAVSNAARLYDQMGERETAQALHERAEYFRKINPYYRYRQGLDAFARHEYLFALEHTGAAIRYYNKEHRFYFLQGAIYSRLGNDKLAEKNLLKAISLTDDTKQNSRYRRKMDLLRSTDFVSD